MAAHDMPPLVVIAGATATGKTALALDLAEALIAGGRPTEIISADSRQVYRGLDIGTAKVTVADQARVPHHGLDLVNLDEPFSVADFVVHARAALGAIAGRGGTAILAGGTGLYLRAIARGLDTSALPSDPEIRARLEAELATDGVAALAARLARQAPYLAANIDLQNSRRVVRALEIAEIRGDGPLPPTRGYGGPLAWVGLALNPAEHRRRIAARAREQFDAGLIEEAAALRARFDPGLPAFSAIGYAEAWAVLDGELTRETAIDRDAARNIAFARRQGTWFRSEPDIAWHDTTNASPLAEVLEVTRRLG